MRTYPAFTAPCANSAARPSRHDFGVKMRILAHAGLPEIREQWNSLVEKVERPQVFYTYEWAQAVARTYGEWLKPLILTAHREEHLVGAVALAQDPVNGRVSFLAGSTADYCDFISAADDRRELVLLALQELRNIGVREISFANLPADSISARVLQSNPRESRFSIFRRPAYVCAQVLLDTRERRSQVRKSAGNKLRRF